MRSYLAAPWLLRAWQDVFVDLVQAHLQHLFLMLLAGAPAGCALRHTFESLSLMC